MVTSGFGLILVVRIGLNLAVTADPSRLSNYTGIDKSSSAELQETINSMWRYYAESNICYVYMDDVPDAPKGWGAGFGKSRWFTRGWTLQELIAPTSVEFYARNWVTIGTKAERYRENSEVTNINADVLTHRKPIDAFSAAEKLSWAAHRQVAREEDETYCLLGIFDVNMPMLYGEGRQRAFFRLQAAIYSSTLDHSLFLSSMSPYWGFQPLLADCPARFCPKKDFYYAYHFEKIRMFPTTISYTKLTARNRNMQSHDQIWAIRTSYQHEVSTAVQLLKYDDVADKLIFLEENISRPDSPSHIAVLNYTLEDQQGGALCLLLCKQCHGENNAVFVRLRCYPVILPRVNELATKSRLERILVVSAPRDMFSMIPKPLAIYFTFTSESFEVKHWRTKKMSEERQVEIEGQKNTDLIITPTDRGEVSCFITDTVKHVMQINIQLGLIGERWSIKDVDELNSRWMDPIQHTLLFRSTIFCDRCSVVTSNGLRWSIALRRLPATMPKPNGEMLPRYQIRVSRAEMEAPSLTPIAR